MIKKNKKLNFNLDFLGSKDNETELLQNSSVVNQASYKKKTIQEKIEDNVEEKSEKQKNELNDNTFKDSNNNQEKPDGCLMPIIITVIIFVLVIALTIWNESIEEKKQIEIQQTNSLAYDYKLERSPLFEETVDKLAKLTKKSSEEIKQELQQKFEAEKEQQVLNIINNYIETGVIDENKIINCQKRFFNNDQIEYEKTAKEYFFRRHEEISKQILKDWQDKSENFEKNKQKYC